MKGKQVHSYTLYWRTFSLFSLFSTALNTQTTTSLVHCIYFFSFFFSTKKRMEFLLMYIATGKRLILYFIRPLEGQLNLQTSIWGSCNQPILMVRFRLYKTLSAYFVWFEIEKKETFPSQSYLNVYWFPYCSAKIKSSKSKTKSLCIKVLWLFKKCLSTIRIR